MTFRMPAMSVADGEAAPAIAEGLSLAVPRRWLVRDVSLRLAAGRLTGLIGPNGAGKSTLLRALAGILTPTRGRVVLLGTDLAVLGPPEVARRLARMAQQPPAVEGLTALDVVLMGRYAHHPGWRERRQDLDAARLAMQLTATAALADQPYETLSGGERQRVLLARALAQETAVLLLDEPTASLDLTFQLSMLELVRDLTRQRRLGTLIALHDLSLAARFCDEILLLSGGRLVAAGPPEAVIRPEYLRRVFGIEAIVERHPRVGSLVVIPVSVARSEEAGLAESGI